MKPETQFKKSKSAFTLIEVMIAVGIVAVSLTALIGLLAAIVANVNQIRYQTKSLAIVSALETNLKMMPFAQVYDKMAKEMAFTIYFWDEYQNPDDLDNRTTQLVCSEDANRKSGEPPSDSELKISKGEVYRVVVYPYKIGLKGELVDIESEDVYDGSSPLPGSHTNYALLNLPLSVKIFVDPRDDIVEGLGDPQLNDRRLVLSDIVIVKLR